MGHVTDFFRMATDTFTGIKDAVSAEAAAPQLRALSTKLETLRVGLSQLPTDARARLVALVQDLGAKQYATGLDVTSTMVPSKRRHLHR
jgi:FixJ family two-component response regulator